MVSRRDEIGELIAPPEDDYDYDAKPVAAAAPKQAPAPVQMASAAPTKPAAVASAAMRKKAAIIGKTADTGVRTTTKGARHMAKGTIQAAPCDTACCHAELGNRHVHRAGFQHGSRDEPGLAQ